MFNSFEEIKNHFKEPDIFKMLDAIFKMKDIQNKAIILNLAQLERGEDANGKIIKTIGGSPYRPYTISVKKSKGQPTNIVTLEDTGAFYKTFKMKGYEITANYDKPDGSILDNFTSDFDFTGLTDTSLFELVMESIYPELSKMLREQYVI